MYFYCMLIQVLNGVTSGPSPAPGLIPPSHQTPSEVGDGHNGGSGRVTLLPLGGTGGRVRAAELPLGGTGGGGVRAAELPLDGSGGRDGAMLSLGANAAHSGEGEHDLAPTPGILPPSHPNTSKVGEGLCIKGDGGGGDGRSISFTDLCSLLNAAPNNASSLAKNRHLSAPTQTTPTHRLRILKVCFILKSL